MVNILLEGSLDVSLALSLEPMDAWLAILTIINAQLVEPVISTQIPQEIVRPVHQGLFL